MSNNNFKNTKLSLFDVIYCFLHFVFALFFMPFMFNLPVLIWINKLAFFVTTNNIIANYIFCFLNLVWTILYSEIATKMVFDYNIEYKTHGGDSITKFLEGLLVLPGVIPIKISVHIFHLLLLVCIQLVEMKTIASYSISMDVFFKINYFSIVVVMAIEAFFMKMKRERFFVGYRIKRCFEFSLMRRVDIMKKNTLQRVVYLFKREEYKKINLEFGYVIDEMPFENIDEYEKFSQKNKEQSQKMFWCFYQRVMKNAEVIEKENIEFDKRLKMLLFSQLPKKIYEVLEQEGCFAKESEIFCFITEARINIINKILKKHNYKLHYEEIGMGYIYLYVYEINNNLNYLDELKYTG